MAAEGHSGRCEKLQETLDFRARCITHTSMAGIEVPSESIAHRTMPSAIDRSSAKMTGITSLEFDEREVLLQYPC